MVKQKISRIVVDSNVIQCAGDYSGGRLNSTIVCQDKATINGVDYPFTDKMRKGSSVSNINGKLYVDGHELVKGVWKKTLTALWYKFF